jgi:hypothetical protein
VAARLQNELPQMSWELLLAVARLTEVLLPSLLAVVQAPGVPLLSSELMN